MFKLLKSIFGKSEDQRKKNEVSANRYGQDLQPNEPYASQSNPVRSDSSPQNGFEGEKGKKR